MAISKFISQVHPPKSGGLYSGVRRLLNYILNPEKTQDCKNVGSLNCGCTIEQAMHDMISTKKYFGKERRDPHHRLAYHWALSWSPEEDISEEDALRITREFCERYFGENHEVVFAVHNDKGHIHSHICFNSVNRMNGYMYRYNVGDWAKSVQPLVDQVCQENGYHTLEMDTGMNLEQYYKEHIKPKKEKNSAVRRNNCKYHKEEAENIASKGRYKAMSYIKEDIDSLVLEVDSYDQFIDRLRDFGYCVREGKYLTLQPRGSSARIRTYHIGEGYTIEEIKERIAQPKQRKEELRMQTEKRNLVPYMEGNLRLEFLFPFRLQHMKTIQAPLTKYQKRNYYRMFRYSVKRAGKKLNYSEINKSLRNIRRLEEEMEMADIYSIESVSQIRDIRENMYQSLKTLDKTEKRVVKRQIGILWRMEEGIKEEMPSDIDNKVKQIMDIVNSDQDRSPIRKGINISRSQKKKRK